MAWQGPNYVRDGHVLFPHYHFNNYGWIKNYYAHRYHPQKGVIVTPAPQAAGSDSVNSIAAGQTATPGQSAAPGQTVAKPDAPPILNDTLPLRPALSDAQPQLVAPAAKPLPHPVTPPPHPAQPRLTPEQVQNHFAGTTAPDLGHTATSAAVAPKAPRLAAATTVRTERPALAAQPDADPPQHGFAASTLLILLALFILGAAASTYIIGHLFFRGLRA